VLEISAEPTLVDPTTVRGRAFVPVLVFVGLLVATVSSLGAPLIPTIAADYGVSLGSAQWSLTITLLVGAVATPVVGRLGDGPHRQLVLLAALAALVIGNVFAALSAPFALLLIGRGLQGFGLALIPLAMSIARDHLDPVHSRSALATLSITAIVGVGLGYPLTGLVAQHFSFHIAFWIAAGLGAVAIVGTILVVPSSGHQEARAFDLPGACLLGLGLAGLLLAISEVDEWGFGSTRFLILLPASLVALAGWVWFEARTSMPLIDLRLMRHRTVLSANVTVALAGVGLYMTMSMVIRYVQTPKTVDYGLGASVLVAGLVLVPMSVTSVPSSKLVTYLSRWIKPERLLPLGVLTLALGLIFFALDRSQLWECFVVMGITGIGVGAVFAVIPRLIVSAVPAEETSSALALTQVVRTIGFSIGSALSATILTAHTPSGSLLPHNSGYTVGATVGAGLGLVTAALGWFLARPSTTRPAVAGDDLLVDESVDAAAAGVFLYETDPEPHRS
jgi:predicted MFS family arabinose efflux permease